MTVPRFVVSRFQVEDGADNRLPSMRERMRALRHVPILVSMVWETHRGLTCAMIALRILRGLVPVATLWIAKLIVDAVVAARESGTEGRELLALVLLELAVVVVGDVLARISGVVDVVLSDLFSNRVSMRLMEHAATLDLAKFEDSAFYDHLERARKQTNGRVALIAQLLAIVEGTVALAALTVALLAFDPWLVLLLFGAVVPSFLGETRFAALQYSLTFRWTQRRRQLDYLLYVGVSDRTAKEVQLLGLSPWLISRYEAIARRWRAENRGLACRRGVVGAALAVVGTAGYYSAYLVIIARTVSGALTLGALSFLAASFIRGRDLSRGILAAMSGVYDESLYLRDLLAFFAMRPSIISVPEARPVPRPMREGIVFEDVGFRYPGSDRWAVRHVSLVLRPGERVALVGENGAGKTTLTKLLARLYDPTEGRILLDGVDLREYDVGALRREVGVIFQDFVRYEMRFDENIGVGDIGVSQSYLDGAAEEGVAVAPQTVPVVLRVAAEKSLAAGLVAQLPDGWHQMLGRRFDGGVELSGGEWQRIALARAHVRDAQVLILDEPTAALDARAEYEVYLRFSELSASRMALIVSHRFSTVRMADRIVVLRYGEVVESGMHDELVSRAGLYSELFGMQAAGYR